MGEHLPGIRTTGVGGETTPPPVHGPHGEQGKWVDDDTRFEWGGLKLDYPTKAVTLGGKTRVIKDPITFEIFKAIARRRGGPITRTEIEAEVRGILKKRFRKLFVHNLGEDISNLIQSTSGPGATYSLRLSSDSRLEEAGEARPT
jgi:DNA-binding response OmpR family regulator